MKPELEPLEELPLDEPLDDPLEEPLLLPLDDAPLDDAEPLEEPPPPPPLLLLLHANPNAAAAAVSDTDKAMLEAFIVFSSPGIVAGA